MKVLRLAHVNFRNLVDDEFIPHEGFNLIFGENGQGKTNLLEALWLFTGNKSFRNNKDSELIKFEENGAKLNMSFFSQQREQGAQIDISLSRQATLNGVKLSSPAMLSRALCAMTFTPEHLSLVSDGPAKRRRFLDEAIAQLRPKYGALINEYNHIITQRNALLKDIPYHSDLYDTLDVWEEKAARAGANIVAFRCKYISRLKEVAGEIYGGLSGQRESFSLRYDCSFCSNPEELSVTEFENALTKRLFQGRKEDIASGHSSMGPHRDDMEIYIKGVSARAFGSQGQKRSAVLALKLGEAKLLEEDLKETPIALLDDVMSELDSFRQKYMLESFKGWQVFITTCNNPNLLENCALFLMKDGRVSRK